jgi:hypothetical protein
MAAKDRPNFAFEVDRCVNAGLFVLRESRRGRRHDGSRDKKYYANCSAHEKNDVETIGSNGAWSRDSQTVAGSLVHRSN